MKFVLTHLLICACFYTCTLFEFKCPYTSEWKFRAFGHCNRSSSTQYQCLFDELGQHRLTKLTFIESCHYKPDYVQPGYKYVFSGGRLKQQCSLEKYQPMLFWSNVTHACLFSKSKCSDIGQITHNNETTENDRQCRCDYKKGYDFMFTPLNKCFCVPSVEDCSCYKKTCNGTRRLSPDYKCTELKESNNQLNCPPLSNTGNTETKESKNIKKRVGHENISKQTNRSAAPAWFTAITIIVLLVISFCVVTERLPEIFIIRLNPVVNIGATLNEDYSIKLTWTFPNIKYERSRYTIKYTYDDWKTFITFNEEAPTPCIMIKNVVPFKTYRICIIYYCTYDGNEFESLPSNETIIETNSPKLDVMATKDFDAKCLKLSWSKPENTNIDVTLYTVIYSCDDWKHATEDSISASKSSYEIKHILPLKTYKCKVRYTCSCSPTYETTETCQSELSNEVSVDTDRPGSPESLKSEGLEGSMTLRWAPPSKTLFETKKYRIQYTTDNSWNMAKCEFRNADEPLEYSITDLLKLTVYRFRVYTCTDNGSESFPSQEIFSNIFACKYHIPIENIQHNANFDNPDSQECSIVTEDLTSEVDRTCEQIEGTQKSFIKNFRDGSLIVSLILTSQNFYNDIVLRKIIEDCVIKGQLGRFTTRHDGFTFQVLNMPLPPNIDKLSVQNKCIKIKWSLQRKSFFKIKQFKLEVATDDSCGWKNATPSLHTETEFKYRIENLSSTTTFKFRVVTCTHNLIESRPSDEMQTTVFVPMPVIKMKVTLVYTPAVAYRLTWDQQSMCSTSSVNSIDCYKILVNGKEVDSTRHRSYTYSPGHSDNARYTFAVKACDENGFESEKGEEVTCDMNKGPLPPRNVTTQSTSTGIQISWEKPTYPKGVKTFTIKIQNDEKTFVTVDGTEKTFVTVDGTEKTRLLHGLEPQTKYSLSMSTCSIANFEGSFGSPVECVTEGPLPPTQLRVVECAKGIELTWIETKFPVSRYVKNYNVYTKLDNKECVTKAIFPFCLIENINSSCKYAFSCSTLTSNGIESERSEIFVYESLPVLEKKTSFSVEVIPFFQ